MTISGWHDDYRNKDAGHDEMQATIWRYYREADRQAHDSADDPTRLRLSVWRGSRWSFR